MTANSNELQQNEPESALSDLQRKAIPHLVVAGTVSEGCRRAHIDRTSYYRWMEQPAFQCEIERHRQDLSDQAFNTITENLSKAVGVLGDLLDDNDKKVRRYAAKDIISLFRLR